MTGAHATHNRAGEIIYSQIGELTIRATIITYTRTSSVDADRDSLTMLWGDGTQEAIQRSNGIGSVLEGDIKLNYYIAEHTYPARGTYTMSFTDPNRIDGIVNVNAPNSIEVPFYVQTTFTFLNSQFQGSNSSVQLLKEPIDFGCVGQPFVHNPNAFDPDGDSIGYELVVPQEAPGFPVPKYKYPDEIVIGPFNQIYLDPITGDFRWESPQIVGEYNIAIKISEYRQGVLIGSVIRDMQIFVDACDNQPPTIESIEEICVVAGEVVRIPMIIDDPDMGQQVKVSATGGPFQFGATSATLDIEEMYFDPELEVTLEWQTTCEHISNSYYQVVVRAVDDFFNINNTGLAGLNTIRIKVVGPPPKNLQTETFADGIELTWDSPYVCEDAKNDYFNGFSVWRKLKSSQFPLDTCNPGLEGKSYQKIVYNTREEKDGSYFYFDSDVIKGNTYCYRILAEFAKISPAGYPYNPVESLPSNEACGILIRDIPLITKVSVESTDATEGAINIKWIRPKVPDLDTILFPGPYRYQLLRGEGINPTSFSEISSANYTSQFFNSTIDTIFKDTNLNTVDQPYSYMIDFYTSQNSGPYGSSAEASSIFLGKTSNDRLVDLLWAEDVPWENYEYTIYRKNDMTGIFDSIATSIGFSYRDQGLENGKEYCYLVRSEGTYGIAGIEDPLFNFSQEVCDIPKDSLPPCVPNLNVLNLCDSPDIIGPNGELLNKLLWTEKEEGCFTDSDLNAFNIYFSKDSVNFEIIEQTSFEDPFAFDHILENSISGCYAVSAIDSSGNESELSEIICSTNCPLYELPNVFTPNGDGSNDLFVPRVNRFVAQVDMKIFNRWGNIVFKTSDPNVNWDGTNLAGIDLAEGVYFYSCIVSESLIGGNLGPVIGKLSGSIQLIRSN